MPIRAIYIRLSPSELELLEAMAIEERRPMPEQAAHLVSQAVSSWAAHKAFEAAIENEATA